MFGVFFRVDKEAVDKLHGADVSDIDVEAIKNKYKIDKVVREAIKGSSKETIPKMCRFWLRYYTNKVPKNTFSSIDNYNWLLLFKCSEMAKKKGLDELQEYNNIYTFKPNRFNRNKNVLTEKGYATMDVDDVVAKDLRGNPISVVYKKASYYLNKFGKRTSVAALKRKYEHLNPTVQRLILGNKLRTIMNHKRIKELPAFDGYLTKLERRKMADSGALELSHV